MRKRSATNRAPDARASLLQWVRDRLAPLASKGLPEIRDLHGSWRSGALFAGLIHSHNRSLLPNGLEAFIDAHDSPHLWADHLACLFSLADKALGIPALLDPSDLVGVETPDERSVMTYLSQY
ncbi:MAG: calponin homology domain-containing protein, partial [Piptocephalis tieghemiana]